MDVDENAFFHQATVLICRNLDIEISMHQLLRYLKSFLPVDAMFLNVFEQDLGAIRTIASATESSSTRLDRLTYLDRQAREHMKSGKTYLKKFARLKAQIINQPETHVVSRLMVNDFETPDTSHLALTLSIDDELVGNLILEAQGNNRYSEEHADLLSLLNEPMAIAIVNALKHDEIVRLNDALQEDNRYLRKNMVCIYEDDIIGRDFGLKNAVSKAEQVAPLNSPVLLLGETGTGKELLATLIHKQSERRDNPLVTINCGAIPDTLLDSDYLDMKRVLLPVRWLKKGHFERADGGTVFLDEIGELPPQAQVRLLRVIQNGEIKRIGGNETISVDVRIIAATHRDLESMVKVGEFREDLWYRLNVFPIVLPPLRERPNDIPALVQYLIQKKARSLNIRPAPGLREGAIDPLMTYPWPGNVRELENIIERALITGEGAPISFSNFILPAGEKIIAVADQPDVSLAPLDQTITEQLKAALRLAKGRIHGKGGAAELIAINPNTFRSKMRKLGIQK